MLQHVHNLMGVLREQLLNSRTDAARRIGLVYHLCLPGRGVDKTDDVSASQISASKMQFTPHQLAVQAHPRRYQKPCLAGWSISGGRRRMRNSRWTRAQAEQAVPVAPIVTGERSSDQTDQAFLAVDRSSWTDNAGSADCRSRKHLPSIIHDPCENRLTGQAWGT